MILWIAERPRFTGVKQRALRNLTEHRPIFPPAVWRPVQTPCSAFFSVILHLLTL
jgi:hypothetical protein